MNRIYQGRVHCLELLGNSGESPQIFEKAHLKHQANNPLWQHHEIFQDAINYYLVALASLANPGNAESDRFVPDLRKQVESCWEAFPRPVSGAAKSLKDSVGPWLGLGATASFEDAASAILAGNEADTEILTLALKLLLEKCGGDGAIQQGGRGYFPRFCVENTNPTYDFSADSKMAERGRDKLVRNLHKKLTQNELFELAKEIELRWTVKIEPGKVFNDSDSRERLTTAVSHTKKMLKSPKNSRLESVVKEFSKHEEILNGFLSLIPSIPKPLEIPCNRKANKDVTFATLVFKYFPCLLSAALLKAVLGQPNVETQSEESDATNFSKFGDDPIKLARGKRGYVFPAFTALSSWQSISTGEPIWKEFDIAAFKEALKVFNQFKVKTDERDKDKVKHEERLATYLGKPPKKKKTTTVSDEGEEAPPEELDKALFNLARRLEAQLTAELSESVLADKKTHTFGETVFTFRSGEWRISRASLRGYRQIAEEWNKLYEKCKCAPARDQLAEVVKNFQRDEKNRATVGSVSLFLALCEETYWPLWLAEDAMPDSEGELHAYNTFLYKMAEFYEEIRKWENSLSPIKLTPAEPRHSRRLYMFTDVGGQESAVKFKTGEGEYAIECGIAVKCESGKIRKRRIRMHYNAPRLLRDELLGGGESRWLQPMMLGLGLKPSELNNSVKKIAVSLMPDFGHSKYGMAGELRLLLNFPVELDAAPLREKLGKSNLWQGQFNGGKDINLHLHWPKTAKTKQARETPWWENESVIKNGFTVLSTDLGQRVAGAWALLRITCHDPRKHDPKLKRPVREIGNDGKRSWYAEVVSTGIFRLPGEDQVVQHKDRQFKEESFGKSGRNSREHEYREALALAKALYADCPENWVGKTVVEKSYSEQNDSLIALARRRLSRLNTFHRWSCFDPEQPEVASRKEASIKKLAEELSHWEDPEVKKWESLFVNGDYTGFRTAAGRGFDALREELGKHLVAIANRVVPLRDRSWEWKPSAANKCKRQLMDSGRALGTTASKTWIRGQRGLSMSRIEQLDGLRQLFLRHNRSFDRDAGTPANFGRTDRGRETGEPCELLLEKIERMKEQRVDQTAHLILAQALGVRLKAHTIPEEERARRDIHGEYERIPGRAPVDFIVIENLSRYIASQGRSRSENSRLMQWSHRAIRDKIKMLAEEPFGIAVVETHAAYSSRFSGVNSFPGDRLEEIDCLDDFLKAKFKKLSEKQNRQGQPDASLYAKLIEQFESLEAINTKTAERKTPYTLFIPMKGGQLFLPLGGGSLCQADINAAINLGLRAVAAPEALHLIHKIRVKPEKGRLYPAIHNEREKAIFDKNSEISQEVTPDSRSSKGLQTNYFFDGCNLIKKGACAIKIQGKSIPLASGAELWGYVNKYFLEAIIELNARRLKKWGYTDDEIPM